MSNLLKGKFPPEFLNRIDETLIFRPLSKESLTKIVDLQLKDLADRLAEEELTLKVSDKTKTAIIEEGYDPDFGARPLKRAIQRILETPIARDIIAGKYPPGSTVEV